MDRGYYSGNGLTNFEEQRMCKEMVGGCWLLMVVTEERNVEVLGSWAMLRTCLGNREGEKDEGVLALLYFTLNV